MRFSPIMRLKPVRQSPTDLKRNSGQLWILSKIIRGIFLII